MTAPDDVQLETTVDGDDESRSTFVHTSIIATDGTNHTASWHADGDAADVEVAGALLRIALAAAQMHSQGAYWELQRRIQGHSEVSS